MCARVCMCACACGRRAERQREAREEPSAGSGLVKEFSPVDSDFLSLLELCETALFFPSSVPFPLCWR